MCVGVRTLVCTCLCLPIRFPVCIVVCVMMNAGLAPDAHAQYGARPRDSTAMEDSPRSCTPKPQVVKGALNSPRIATSIAVYAFAP